MVTSLTYIQAVQQLPHHFTLSFLHDLYQYARTNLPEKEVIERFLVLTPDLLLGVPPEQLSMSMDVIPSSQNEVVQLPSAQLPSAQLPSAQLPSAQVSTGLPSVTPAPATTGMPSMSLPPPPIQGSSVSFSAGVSTQNQFSTVSAVPTFQSILPPANTVTYASVAAFSQAISGEQATPFTTSTPGPNPVLGQLNHSGSPTYATLTPVQITPPGLASGSFLPPLAGTGSEFANDDSISKRNRQRFTQKSAPYPTQN